MDIFRAFEGYPFFLCLEILIGAWRLDFGLGINFLGFGLSLLEELGMGLDLLGFAWICMDWHDFAF